MKQLIFLIFITPFFVFSQDTIQLKPIDSFKFKADQIIGVDNFKTFYFTKKDNSFNKKQQGSVMSYSNILLGKISSANTLNPLKINIFYRDFNTLIILDNRLAEVFKIDFNSISEYKNVALASTGYDNTVWIFNQDSQQLELYDYKANLTRVSSIQIQDEVLDLESNYNYCWLLTKQHLYIYNYFGSLLFKLENNGYTNLYVDSGNAYLQKENALIMLPKNATEFIPIQSSRLLINQFLVTGESLYIYDDEMLHQFQLKID